MRRRWRVVRVASPCPWCGAEVTLEVEAGSAGSEELWLACNACWGCGCLADALRSAERRGYMLALEALLGRVAQPGNEEVAV